MKAVPLLYRGFCRHVSTAAATVAPPPPAWPHLQDSCPAHTHSDRRQRCPAPRMNRGFLRLFGPGAIVRHVAAPGEERLCGMLARKKPGQSPDRQHLRQRREGTGQRRANVMVQRRRRRD
eukprot:754463-Hanusia_phi.AAC.3